MIAVLAFKEISFILWAAATHLQRADVAQRLDSEIAVARSMGYSRQISWWRVAWPQLWPRLRWPLLAVLAWRWLLDGDVARNSQGAAAAWLLTLLLALTAAVAWQIPKFK